MPSELEELVTFLHSPQPAVVQIALDNLVGYSQGPTRKVFTYNHYEPISDLKKLAKDKGRTNVMHLITILTNLCDAAEMRKIIVEDADFLKYLIAAICNPHNTNADLMCILLSNLAKNDSITKVLGMVIDRDENQKKIFKSDKAIDCLMDCFVKGADRSLNKFANYDYLAYFFADLSRFKEGRDYFVTEQLYDNVIPLSKLLVFTEKYDSRIRREGVASTIKNSLFDIQKHERLLTDSSIDLLPYILLPIAGPEEIEEDYMFDLPDALQLLPSDKVREPLPQIICTYLESILLLCSTREIREYLREKAVYAIIRELHKSTNDEKVADLCDRVVQMLMRDEEPEKKKENNGENSESDEEDDKIVEVL